MTINKILRFVCLTCLFLMPLVALIVSTSLFFPYITGKNFAFRVLVEIMFVCWAALAFRDPAYRPRIKSPITISLVAFIVIIFLADLFGEYFYKSFFSNFERMEGFITFLHLLGLFFVSTLILRSEQLWRRLFQTTFIVSAIIGFVGVYQRFHNHVSRVDGTFGNSTYLGALMLFNIFLLFFYLMRALRSKSNSWKYSASLYILGIIFDLYILILTGTRGAVLGVLGGVIFIAVVFAISKREQKIVRYTGAGLVALIILSFILIVSLQNTSIIKNNQSTSRLIAPVNAVLTGNITGFLDTEGRGRLLIWEAAIKGFEERPILGWGQENFNYIFNQFYTANMYTEEQWFDRSHNVILDWLTQGGILGLLSYLSMFGFLIYSIWRKSKEDNFSLEDKTILTALLIGYFIHNFFVFDNINSYILFFSILAYVNWFKYERRHEAEKVWKIHPDIANYALIPVVAIVVAALFYIGVFRPYIAAAELIKALGNEQSGTISATLANFQKALSPHTFGAPEVREQIMTAVPYVVSSKDTDENKQAFVTYMQSQMEDQLRRTPNDARYNLFYGFALDRIGDLTDGQTYLEKAHALSPEKQTISFELGLNYLAQTLNQKAVDLLKATYESAPSYAQARVTYTIALIYSNKLSEASDLLKDAPSTVLNDNSLLKAYYQTGNYGSAVGIYHQREVASSSDIQSYLGAAGFYLAGKNNGSAIAELQRLEEVLKGLIAENPTNTEYPQDLTAVGSFITKIRAGENPLPISG